MSPFDQWLKKNTLSYVILAIRTIACMELFISHGMDENYLWVVDLLLFNNNIFKGTILVQLVQVMIQHFFLYITTHSQ